MWLNNTCAEVWIFWDIAIIAMAVDALKDVCLKYLCSVES